MRWITFQSSPDCYAGRNAKGRGDMQPIDKVSILARLLRRAQHVRRDHARLTG